MGAFKVAMTPCTLIYRFVHTSGSPGNSPEMLGTAKPESEGFSAQTHEGLRRHEPNAADV